MSQTELPYHKARKRFGQNFLHDHSVIREIVASINPKRGEHLVEIGPGQGALTADVLERAGALDVVELDRDLIPALLLRFGNLPYNISTPLIFHLLSFTGLVQDMHFMLQKEVVQRLAAGAGENHYGRMGIMAQYYCQVDYLFTVGPESFRPAPKVDSAIVRLTPYRELPHPCQDIHILEQVIRDAFSQRRKTIRNTLRQHLKADELAALAIDPAARPEVLTVADFVRIADYLTDH